ncbi:hypothetical protein EYF80_007884 [Liparis tanakae]|uniref:Uncharacterized protein n=1 Tax=Liparis tanakae TaxID=230148 RepID=A0A4Z2IUZ2_9TELE|nr:hypothetical protein EYF80_007884 [Liparis tanakae]
MSFPALASATHWYRASLTSGPSRSQLLTRTSLWPTGRRDSMMGVSRLCPFISQGGNSLTSASRASTMWGLVEVEVEEEEEEEEEGRAEGVLLPEEDREDEVSTGEETVREAVMEKRER